MNLIVSSLWLLPHHEFIITGNFNIDLDNHLDSLYAVSCVLHFI